MFSTLLKGIALENLRIEVSAGDERIVSRGDRIRVTEFGNYIAIVVRYFDNSSKWRKMLHTIDKGIIDYIASKCGEMEDYLRDMELYLYEDATANTNFSITSEESKFAEIAIKAGDRISTYYETHGYKQYVIANGTLFELEDADMISKVRILSFTTATNKFKKPQEIKNKDKFKGIIINKVMKAMIKQEA